MKKLYENHGMVLMYLAMVVFAALIGRSAGDVLIVAVCGMFFCIYDKLHDILIALRTNASITQNNLFFVKQDEEADSQKESNERG